MNYDSPLVDPRPWDPPEDWDPPESDLGDPYWVVSDNTFEDCATPAELPAVLRLYGSGTATLHFSNT
jgi:hypothetical protein